MEIPEQTREQQIISAFEQNFREYQEQRAGKRRGWRPFVYVDAEELQAANTYINDTLLARVGINSELGQFLRQQYGLKQMQMERVKAMLRHSYKVAQQQDQSWHPQAFNPKEAKLAAEYLQSRESGGRKNKAFTQFLKEQYSSQQMQHRQDLLKDIQQNFDYHQRAQQNWRPRRYKPEDIQAIRSMLKNPNLEMSQPLDHQQLRNFLDQNYQPQQVEQRWQELQHAQDVSRMQSKLNSNWKDYKRLQRAGKLDEWKPLVLEEDDILLAKEAIDKRKQDLAMLHQIGSRSSDEGAMSKFLAENYSGTKMSFRHNQAKMEQQAQALQAKQQERVKADVIDRMENSLRSYNQAKQAGKLAAWSPEVFSAEEQLFAKEHRDLYAQFGGSAADFFNREYTDQSMQQRSEREKRVNTAMKALRQSHAEHRQDAESWQPVNFSRAELDDDIPQEARRRLQKEAQRQAVKEMQAGREGNAQQHRELNQFLTENYRPADVRKRVQVTEQLERAEQDRLQREKRLREDIERQQRDEFTHLDTKHRMAIDGTSMSFGSSEMRTFIAVDKGMHQKLAQQMELSTLQFDSAAGNAKLGDLSADKGVGSIFDAEAVAHYKLNPPHNAQQGDHTRFLHALIRPDADKLKPDSLDDSHKTMVNPSKGKDGAARPRDLIDQLIDLTVKHPDKFGAADQSNEMRFSEQLISPEDKKLLVQAVLKQNYQMRHDGESVKYFSTNPLLRNVAAQFGMQTQDPRDMVLQNPNLSRNKKKSAVSAINKTAAKHHAMKNTPKPVVRQFTNMQNQHIAQFLAR